MFVKLGLPANLLEPQFIPAACGAMRQAGRLPAIVSHPSAGGGLTDFLNCSMEDSNYLSTPPGLTSA
jgi:hypothetical protein